MTPAERMFVEFSANKLRQLTARIEVCLDKLSPAQVWARGSENSNAIGNLVLHLSGNVRQWILHGVAGAPDIRRRDDEFNAEGGVSVTELRERLRGVVEEAAEVISRLTTADLEAIARIQNYEIPKLQAVYHVVEHFSQHAGQIIFATKFLTGEELGFYTHLKNPKHGERTP